MFVIVVCVCMCYCLFGCVFVGEYVSVLWNMCVCGICVCVEGGVTHVTCNVYSY